MDAAVDALEDPMLLAHLPSPLFLFLVYFLLSKRYDTHASGRASEQLADDIDAVPEGHFVVAAVMDEARTCLTERGMRALESCGSSQVPEATAPSPSPPLLLSPPLPSR